MWCGVHCRSAYLSVRCDGSPEPLADARTASTWSRAWPGPADDPSQLRARVAAVMYVRRCMHQAGTTRPGRMTTAARSRPGRAPPTPGEATHALPGRSAQTSNLAMHSRRYRYYYLNSLKNPYFFLLPKFGAFSAGIVPYVLAPSLSRPSVRFRSLATTLPRWLARSV